MKVRLSAIERDTGIQCRASIDMGVVNDYAQAMGEGTEFPPVVLYGKEDRCWIGDGWHRVMAAEQRGDETIRAELRSGGRTEALKHALGANAAHGHRRSNADKRRCVEIALREFAGMSSRAIAGMCGVTQPFVDKMRPVPGDNDYHPGPRTGQDGKQYPARRQAREWDGRKEEAGEEPKAAKARAGAESPYVHPSALMESREEATMKHANAAIAELSKIRPNAVGRAKAFATVKAWIDKNEHTQDEEVEE